MGTIGLIVAGYISYNLQRTNARQEVIEKASVLMESALGVRSYTVKEVRPLISKASKQKFLPQTVPAYAASWYVKELQKKHPDYSYKEAALNPTNPSNRATDWEADIVEYFKGHDDQAELIGERETPTGKSLYLSRPIRITNPGCLACHSSPEIAPATMKDRYGSSNGFGWKMNEVIGAQIVSVPLSLALDRAEKEFFVFIGTILGVFLVVGIALNILLNRFVIRPVALMAEHADKVSMGTLDMPELVLEGKDEIASLGRSFNRMQRSLGNAVNMLNETME
jgi:protein-histidine pros-kinase